MTDPVFAFDNSYAALPERFFAAMGPTPVAAPQLIKINMALAEALGVEPAALASAEGVAALAGNRPFPGASPLAQAYAGHQFGGWSGQLGDGRAILLGEVVGAMGRRDIQLKGAGPTPFSRMGDGRAPLGPVLREYIVSEAMAALGVPTSRALAAVETGETALREDGPLPGAVLTRVAASHIRVGTFEFFSSKRDVEALRLLTEHARERHYPDAEAETPALALLESVIASQAALIAQWMGLGFIHGVMNTDNMTISGETIDYGPCAFMDDYDPARVFSSIDQFGRYAYGNQPSIAHWNLSRLAISLIPLLAVEEAATIEIAQTALDRFPALYEAERRSVFGRKLGLAAAGPADDALIERFMSAMAEEGADFTGVFRALAASTGRDAPIRAALGVDTDWLSDWRARLDGEADPKGLIAAANPLYIPRNHLVEEAIAAGYAGDYGPFEALVEVLARPFDDQPGRERYAAPPAKGEEVLRTFCGT